MKLIHLLLISVFLLTNNSNEKKVQTDPLYYYVITFDTSHKHYISQILKFNCDQNSRFYKKEEYIERAIQSQFLDHLRTKETRGYMPFRLVKFFKSTGAANIAKRKEMADLRRPEITVIEDFTFQFYCLE